MWGQVLVFGSSLVNSQLNAHPSHRHCYLIVQFHPKSNKSLQSTSEKRALVLSRALRLQVSLAGRRSGLLCRNRKSALEACFSFLLCPVFRPLPPCRLALWEKGEEFFSRRLPSPKSVALQLESLQRRFDLISSSKHVESSFWTCYLAIHLLMGLPRSDLCVCVCVCAQKIESYSDKDKIHLGREGHHQYLWNIF